MKFIVPTTIVIALAITFINANEFNDEHFNEGLTIAHEDAVEQPLSFLSRINLLDFFHHLNRLEHAQVAANDDNDQSGGKGKGKGKKKGNGNNNGNGNGNGKGKDKCKCKGKDKGNDDETSGGKGKDEEKGNGKKDEASEK